MSIISTINDEDPVVVFTGRIERPIAPTVIELIPIAKLLGHERISRRTPVQSRLVDVKNSIAAFKNSSFRERLKLAGNRYLDFISGHKKYDESDYSCKPKGAVKRNAESANLADLHAKKARLSAQEIVLYDECYGPEFYIKIEGVPVFGSARTRLKELYKERIRLHWLNELGAQSDICRSAGLECRAYNTLTKYYNYNESLIRLLTNNLPNGKYYATKVKRKCFSICPFCPYNVLDDRGHFLRCPARKSSKPTDDRLPEWLTQVVDSLGCTIPKVNQKLLTMLVVANLCWSYTHNIKETLIAVITDHDRINEEIQRRKPAAKPEKWFSKLFEGVSGTHILADCWEQIDKSAYGWNLNGCTPTTENGGFGGSDFVGKVTVIYK